jgi:WD40 repeat protein
MTTASSKGVSHGGADRRLSATITVNKRIKRRASAGRFTVNKRSKRRAPAGRCTINKRARRPRCASAIRQGKGGRRGDAGGVDGKRLLCSSGGFELRREKVAITVFDLATGKQLRRREEKGERIFPDWRYFAPDGRTLVKHAEKAPGALAEPGTGYLLVRVEVDTGKELRRFTAPDILADPVASTPDGRLLAARSYTQKKDGPRYWHGDRKVRVFDTETGMQRFVVDSDGWQQPLAFTPDGRLLAAAAEGVLVLFDSASGKERWRSPKLDHRIFAVAFAPDGRTLASSQSDGTILIWDIAQTARRGE